MAKNVVSMITEILGQHPGALENLLTSAANKPDVQMVVVLRKNGEVFAVGTQNGLKIESEATIGFILRTAGEFLPCMPPSSA